MSRSNGFTARALACALLTLSLAGGALAKPAKPGAAAAAAKPAAGAKTVGAKSTGAPAAVATQPGPAWVQKSNENAFLVLGVIAKLSPEMSSRFGVPGFDQDILDLSAGYEERVSTAERAVTAQLEQKLSDEKDPPVRQDLEIMIGTMRLRAEGDSLGRALTLPYIDVAGLVFQGVKTLLDDQVTADRRPSAVVRLRKYAGLEKGFTPIAELAADRMRERLGDPKLLGPLKDEVEHDLRSIPTYVSGIGELCKKYQLTGYEEPLAALQKQLADYEAFIRQSVMPRARTDFRQPPALYAYGLKQYGVDMALPEMVSRAEVSFKEIQNQMEALAPLVAKDKGLQVTGYRNVIRELKKRQIVGDAILAHYQSRIREIETIIRRENIATLPNRDMAIRLASEAETAQQPAPHMDPPRMIGNTGEKGTFVLPLHVPAAAGQLDYDDFTHEAVSWTLTAHEGRPGHELQFSSVTEHGVSLARALFAFNSVNVEGWGLYAEAELQPYEPLDGQLFTLQNRLMRAARAFLDPGLQLGTITKDDAMRVLTNDVVLSPAMATQEVERYTFRAPGQATSYFVGYNRLLEIRSEAERALGARFDRKQFNDFVLAQGLIPPTLLKKAVVAEFIPQQAGAAAAAKPGTAN